MVKMTNVLDRTFGRWSRLSHEEKAFLRLIHGVNTEKEYQTYLKEYKKKGQKKYKVNKNSKYEILPYPKG